MIAGIIAAGGRATRLSGQPKALLRMGAKTVVERLIGALRDARVAPIVVVGAAETFAFVQALSAADVLALPSDPQQPMIDSLARAAGMLSPQITGAIVQPVDAPFTSAPLVRALLAGGRDRPRIACFQGIPGHPVFLPARLFGELSRRPPGGLRAILGDAEVELVEWTDESVLADLDTPEDLARWGVGAGE